MKRFLTATIVPLVFFVGACTTSEITTGDLGKTRDTAAGKVLVSSSGMTLYIYDKDTPGKSNCAGMCAVAWPPAKAAPGATARGDFAPVTRADGARQWAYKRKPLYGYAGDEKPGDVVGDGIGGDWHVAHP